MICFCLSVILSAVFVRPAESADPKNRTSLGIFGDWQAYHYQENGQMVCYMITSVSGNGRNAHLMLTHRPKEGELDIFNYSTSTSLSKNDHVSLSIDGSNFNLFAAKENAWAKDPLADRKIASYISHGNKAEVKAKTSKNTNISDTFSLRGSLAAYNTISKKCQSGAKYAGKRHLQN